MHLSLHMSKHHIVGNHMSRLICKLINTKISVLAHLSNYSSRYHASGDLLSADIVCKQFGPRSGWTECRSLSGSKGLSLIVFQKDFFEKVSRQQ